MKCDRKIRKGKRLQKKRGCAGDGVGVAGLLEETQRLQNIWRACSSGNTAHGGKLLPQDSP